MIGFLLWKLACCQVSGKPSGRRRGGYHNANGQSIDEHDDDAEMVAVNGHDDGHKNGDDTQLVNH